MGVCKGSVSRCCCCSTGVSIVFIFSFFSVFHVFLFIHFFRCHVGVLLSEPPVGHVAGLIGGTCWNPREHDQVVQSSFPSCVSLSLVFLVLVPVASPCQRVGGSNVTLFTFFFVCFSVFSSLVKHFSFYLFLFFPLSFLLIFMFCQFFFAFFRCSIFHFPFWHFFFLFSIFSLF